MFRVLLNVLHSPNSVRTVCSVVYYYQYAIFVTLLNNSRFINFVIYLNNSQVLVEILAAAVEAEAVAAAAVVMAIKEAMAAVVLLVVETWEVEAAVVEGDTKSLYPWVLPSHGKHNFFYYNHYYSTWDY